MLDAGAVLAAGVDSVAEVRTAYPEATCDEATFDAGAVLAGALDSTADARTA